MVVFQNNIKRLLRDKYMFIMMVVFPVIFISFIMFSVGGSSPINVAIIDRDATELTSFFKENLSKNCDLMEIKESEIQRKLIRGRTEYAVVIHQGFTQELISGKDVTLQAYSIKETNISIAAKIYIETFMNSVKNIAKAANGVESDFYKGLEYYSSSSLSAEYKSVENTDSKRSYTAAGIGYLLMFMMYLSVNSTSLMLQDKQLKTYGRILSAPVSMKAYTIQNFISGYAVILLQVSLILVIMRFLFNADFGPSILNIYALLVVFAVTSIALGAMINSFSKDSRQANSMSSLLIVPICMIGGSFWPRWLMPDLLQRISKFVPTSWALDAIEKLLYGKTLADIYLEIAMLILFAIVFFLISSSKKRIKHAA